jgi:hypothetical protein
MKVRTLNEKISEEEKKQGRRSSKPKAFLWMCLLCQKELYLINPNKLMEEVSNIKLASAVEAVNAANNDYHH